MGWFLPFAAIGTGAVVIAGLLRSWRRNALEAAAARSDGRVVRAIGVQATDDEMARLERGAARRFSLTVAAFHSLP